VTIFRRIVDAIEDRTGLISTARDIAEHRVPPDTGWWYVFGSATLVAFLIQVVTGIALATVYVSSTGDAYATLKFITYGAKFGSVLRGIHYFGASAMVLLVGIHAIRVFLMGAYKYPREANWLSGVLLLFLTLLMGFTGQLLRFDQNGMWSIVVAANQAARIPFVGRSVARFMLAGDTLGGATLSRFFAFHAFFIPSLIFLFLAIHLFLVIRNGISEPPVAGVPVDPTTYRERYNKLIEEKGVPFWPDVAWRDVVVALLVTAAILSLAWIVGPPVLGKPPDPALIAKDPQPDWYLLWYYAVLALIWPKLTTWVILGAPLTAVVALILVPFFSNKGERHLRKRPIAVLLVVISISTIAYFWRQAKLDPWAPDLSVQPLPESVVGSSSGPIADGGKLFYERGCEYCHQISGFGGRRGPDLTYVADRMNAGQIMAWILGGGYNMPAFSGVLAPQDIAPLMLFLASRKKPHGASASH
jgi:ubiquinol-cytochrome c reductase cytochrome b subunit